MRTPVGDRYVVEHMRKHGYNVGGEQSGHIVLSDFTTTGDGLVSALQVLSVVVGTGQARERGVQALRAGAADAAERALRQRHAARARRRSSRPSTSARRGSGSSGRLVIRPSGTEPVIRVMAEGDDERLVHQVVGDIVEAVRKAAQAA